MTDSTVQFERDEKTIRNFVSALGKAGYTPADLEKISEEKEHQRLVHGLSFFRHQATMMLTGPLEGMQPRMAAESAS